MALINIKFWTAVVQNLRDKCLYCCPTSRVPTKDEFPDLVVNEDEETVRERAEPPARPGEQTTQVMSSSASRACRNHGELDRQKGDKDCMPLT